MTKPKLQIDNVKKGPIEQDPEISEKPWTPGDEARVKKWNEEFKKKKQEEEKKWARK